MPSSKNYLTIEKNCVVCTKPLKLNTGRDIERKKYCSESCKGKAIVTNRMLGVGECSVCETTFNKTSANQRYCSKECSTSCQVDRSYKMLNNNPEKYFKHALYKKGRECLTVDFMMKLLEAQDGRCAISGQRLTFVKIAGNGRVHTNASIDQIIAGGGYTEDNVQLVCDTVNRMKSDMTMDELLFWSKAILEG
jgi:hypothetical protein